MYGFFSSLKRAFLIPCRPLSVNFSHFHLLLQSHWVNFNQTWHNVSLAKGDLSLFTWRATPFPGEITLKKLKKILLQNQTLHTASFGKGDSICSNEGPNPFKGEIIMKSQKYIYKISKSSSPEPLDHFNELGTKHPQVKETQGFTNKDHSIFKRR